MKKSLLSVLFLLIISLPAVKNLLFSGGYTSHDLTHHVVRQISMSRLINEDQFPPRWDANLNNGYGYPVFIFNYPLPAYLGDVFHRLGLSYVDSVKLVIWLSLPLSAIGMYLFLYKWLKEKSHLPAILGAVFYLYAPIRFINVYVSASVGGSLALAIVPFLFWSITKQSQAKTPSLSPLTGLLFALLILSHNLTAMIFTPLVILFTLLSSSRSPNFKKSCQYIAFSLLLGLGLSAYFWVPALVYKNITRFDQVLQAQYLDHFPTLTQLIRSPWGYGMSNPGTDQDGMSFQIGLAHLLVVFLSFIFLFYKKKSKPIQKETLLWLSIFFLSVFLMLQISSPLWQLFPLLPLIQYPFRILSVSLFSASLLTALLLKITPIRSFIFISLLFLVLYANRNHLRINQVFNPGDEYYQSLKTTTASWSEHLPFWSSPAPTESPGKITLTQGQGEVNLTQDNSALTIAEIIADTPLTFRFNQVYYPGWQFSLNHQPIDYAYQDTGSNGVPVFSLPKGDHVFIARFTKTTTHRLSELTSLLSALFSITLAVKYRRHHE